MITGERVKELRKAAGLTRTQMAALLHMSERTVARYESNEKGMPKAVQELMAIKLGLKWPEDFE